MAQTQKIEAPWFRIGHRVGTNELRPRYARVIHNKHYIERGEDGHWRRTGNFHTDVAELFWNRQAELANEAEAMGYADEAEALRTTRRLRKQLANPSSNIWCGIRAAIRREAKARRPVGIYRFLETGPESPDQVEGFRR